MHTSIAVDYNGIRPFFIDACCQYVDVLSGLWKTIEFVPIYSIRYAKLSRDAIH